MSTFADQSPTTSRAPLIGRLFYPSSGHHLVATASLHKLHLSLILLNRLA
jgi:hypothetical protein